jgi:hypothetical protein
VVQTVGVVAVQFVIWKDPPAAELRKYTVVWAEASVAKKRKIVAMRVIFLIKIPRE